MNMREQKGKDIAARLKIERKGDLWIVPSQTGKGKYTVDLEKPYCSCPDFELRALPGDRGTCSEHGTPPLVAS